MLGISPRVEVSVQTFQLLPHMVEGTRRLAMIQERLAVKAVRSAAVRVLPCPFDAPQAYPGASPAARPAVHIVRCPRKPRRPTGEVRPGGGVVRRAVGTVTRRPRAPSP